MVAAERASDDGDLYMATCLEGDEALLADGALAGAGLVGRTLTRVRRLLPLPA